MKKMTMPMRQVRYMHLASKIADMLGITRNEFQEFRALTESLRRYTRRRGTRPGQRKIRRARSR